MAARRLVDISLTYDQPLFDEERASRLRPRTLEAIREESEALDRDYASFLKVPDRPAILTEQAVSSRARGSMPRLLGQPAGIWSKLDAATILVSGIGIGIVITLLAGGLFS